MTKNKKTVVLGATSKPEKYAFKVISLLVEKGHSVIAIGQNAGEVAGVKIKTKAIPLKNITTPLDLKMPAEAIVLLKISLMLSR